MKNPTIKARSSYHVKGQIRSTEYSLQTKDKEKLFDSLTLSAEILAANRGGKVNIQRKKNSLYVNYLDVPNTHIVDRMYLVN